MSAESDFENSDSEPAEPIRLQKFLAAAGLGSRRHCEEYIREGRVTIDGVSATDLGVRVDPKNQTVEVDGERIKRQRKRYYVLNKPPGYVCTNRDPMGRPRAIDLIPGDDTRLFTVGRLDENSRGLILITNDGELAHRVAHPRFSVSRQYHVQVAGKPSQETLKQLRDGIFFSEGKFFVSRVRVLRTQGKSSILEIELHQGRNRELRRMLARVGHKVMNLERTQFGPLHLGRLGLGKYRPLKTSELAELRELADRPAKSGRSSGPKKPARGRGRQGKPSGSPRGGKRRTPKAKSKRPPRTRRK